MNIANNLSPSSSDSFYHDDVSYRAAQVSAPSSDYYAAGSGDLGIATESRRYPYCRCCALLYVYVRMVAG